MIKSSYKKNRLDFLQGARRVILQGVMLVLLTSYIFNGSIKIGAGSLYAD